MKVFPSLFQSTGGTGDTSIGLSIKSHEVLCLGDFVDLNEIELSPVPVPSSCCPLREKHIHPPQDPVLLLPWRKV